MQYVEEGLYRGVEAVINTSRAARRKIEMVKGKLKPQFVIDHGTVEEGINDSLQDVARRRYKFLVKALDRMSPRGLDVQEVGYLARANRTLTLPDGRVVNKGTSSNHYGIVVLPSPHTFRQQDFIEDLTQLHENLTGTSDYSTSWRSDLELGANMGDEFGEVFDEFHTGLSRSITELKGEKG